MKAQKYNLTGNEKFSVWYTTLLMMTNAQLDPNSKARIIKMAKTMCAGEDLDMTKMENDDKEELEKFRKKQEELDIMRDAIWKEMDKITEVLTACYGEPKRGNKHHRCTHNE